MAGGPALAFLGRASYVDAVCWIGSCLADGLHYAHQRGLVHLDIKPSNVLVASDGQPMLLDFHLARAAAPAGAASIDRLGGTRGYMSREQVLGTAAVREGRPLPLAIDGRSDIYSLGVLLYESLAGRLPAEDETESRRHLRRANPLVSRGLEDVLHKCLARNASARYGDAGQLAADLRRHLASLPLRGVANRSLPERWQKWRRRKPHALLLAASGVAALAVVVGTAFAFHAERVRAARSALAEAAEHLDNREFGAAAERSQAGRQAIRWFPWHSDLQQALQRQLLAAGRAQTAAALDTLVARLRFIDGLEALGVTRQRELAAACAKLWQRRDDVAPWGLAQADDKSSARLRNDFVDLALLWSRLRIRLAAPNRSTKSDARRWKP